MFNPSSFIFFYLMQPGPPGPAFRAQVWPYGSFGDSAADFTLKAQHIGHRPFNICSIDIEQYFFLSIYRLCPSGNALIIYALEAS
jgi:hypothetical protein